ncbi:hypothetical protein ACU6VJ_04905 [Sphaerotilus sulfidivorans]|nr:hypothetical protein CQA4T8M7_13060 [Sphaerotilus natans]
MILLLQVTLYFFMVGIIFIFESKNHDCLPISLRPGVVVAVSIGIASIAGGGLDPVDYNIYMSMWVLQVVGVIFGIFIRDFILIGFPQCDSGSDGGRVVATSKAIFIFSVISGLIFFVWKGIPMLQSNIEQGRVDAAAEGTGYVRLFAYMSVPSGLALFALTKKWRKIYLILPCLIIAGMANRSPFLYVLSPIIFFYASKNIKKMGNSKIVAAAIFLMTLIVSLGTYRVFSQEEFSSYDEYRVDIANGNVLGVAWTSFSHYARVVADNAVLTKNLVDRGYIDLQYGLSYLILFVTALPGEQLSLDREIKLQSGRDFVGGGTPPTLMGEGYVNFGYFGTFMSGIAIVLLLSYWYRGIYFAKKENNIGAENLSPIIYGYMACWVMMSQVSGFVGASTVPMAGAIVLFLIWKMR